MQTESNVQLVSSSICFATATGGAYSGNSRTVPLSSPSPTHSPHSSDTQSLSPVCSSNSSVCRNIGFPQALLSPPLLPYDVPVLMNPGGLISYPLPLLTQASASYSALYYPIVTATVYVIQYTSICWSHPPQLRLSTPQHPSPESVRKSAPSLPIKSLPPPQIEGTPVSPTSPSSPVDAAVQTQEPPTHCDTSTQTSPSENFVCCSPCKKTKPRASPVKPPAPSKKVRARPCPQKSPSSQRTPPSSRGSLLVTPQKSQRSTPSSSTRPGSKPRSSITSPTACKEVSKALEFPPLLHRESLIVHHPSII